MRCPPGNPRNHGEHIPRRGNTRVNRTHAGTLVLDSLRGRRGMVHRDDDDRAYQRMVVTIENWMIFPLSDAGISCGLRLDLPKKERKHILIPLGRDMRNAGEKGYLEREIYACSRCGKDQAKPIGHDGAASRGIPARSEETRRDIREILLPSGSPGTVEQENQIR